MKKNGNFLNKDYKIQSTALCPTGVDTINGELFNIKKICINTICYLRKK